MSRTGIVGLTLALLALFPGCRTVNSVISTTADIASSQSVGFISDSTADSVKKSSHAVAKTQEDFTVEQEYYIGRTVGAMIVDRYKVYEHQEACKYLNVMGQALARVSDKPEVFKGYHFQILDSNEVNAFAAPGGFIFVTRGLLRCCPDEEALAAVLAHEIGHGELGHGLEAIGDERKKAAVSVIGGEVLKTVMAGNDLRKVTDLFEGVIDDIATQMFNGYSREAEFAADKAAVGILKRIGYHPGGLVAMLKETERNCPVGAAGFGKTHPSPQDRIANVAGEIGSLAAGAPVAVRQTRFAEAMTGLR